MLGCAGHHLPFRSGCSKAKSSLCRNFMEKGFCPYGSKCQFAHGPQELRINMEHNRSYKTKGCHAFANKGHCCYGSRCNFIHEQTSSAPAGGQKWHAIYANHRTTFQEIQEDGSSRLMHMLNARI
jgi:butyrate response factor